MKPKILLFSLLSVLALTGCGTTPGSSSQGGSSSEQKAQKMTEDQFNLLLNKIQTQGFAVSFNLETLAEGQIVSQDLRSFKCDIETLSFEQFIYEDSQHYSVEFLKDLNGYFYIGGHWSIITLTKEDAETTFENVIETMLDYLIPFRSYADFNFNENTGKYTVDKTITIPRELHYVYTYTMDANGISKIEGSMFDTEELRLTTTSINIGPQTINQPDVQANAGDN